MQSFVPQKGKESGLVPAKAPKPFFQTKLPVNAPGDQFEQEADAAADRAMRMQEGEGAYKPLSNLTVARAQAKCAVCEHGERVGERCLACEKEEEARRARGEVTSKLVSDVTLLPGKPLAPGIRHWMEMRLMDDFGDVVVHTDSIAAEAATSIQARAYTLGNHVVFNAGEYQPETAGGKWLIAHELAHVTQQRKLGKSIQRQPQSVVDKLRDKKIIEEAGTQDTILDAHANAAKDKPEVKRLAARIGKMKQGISDDEKQAFINDLLAIAKDLKAPEELDLVTDVLKRAGRYDEAATLATEKKHKPSRTAFYDLDFYEKNLKDNLGWLTLDYPPIKRFLNDWLGTFDLYIYGPLIKVQTLYSQKEFDKLYKKTVDDANNHTILKENERLLIALEAFRGLDAGRVGMLKGLTKVIPDRWDLIQAFTNEQKKPLFLQWFRETLPPETYHLFELIFPRLVAIMKKASEYWKGVDTEFKVVFKNDLHNQSYQNLFRQHAKRFNIYEKDLYRIMVAAMRLNDKGDLPDAKTYGRMQKTAVAALADLINKVSIHFRQRSRDKGDNRDLMDLYGIFLKGLLNLHYHTGTSLGTDKDKMVNKQINERISIGNSLYNFGDLTGLASIKHIGGEILFPKDGTIFGAKQARSFMTFEEPLRWTQEQFTVSDMIAKFVDETKQLNESKDLAILFQYYYKSVLLQEEETLLSRLLQEQGTTIDHRANLGAYVPILAQEKKLLNEGILSNITESLVPLRYVVKGVEFSVIEKDISSFGIMIQADPHFRASITAKFKDINPDNITLVSPEVWLHIKNQGIVVWMFANPGAFEKRMRQLLPDLVGPQDTPLKYIHELAKVMQTGKTTKDVSAKLEKAQTAMTSDLEKRVRKLQRQAFSHHRRVVVQSEIRELWTGFEDNISTWSNPLDAIRRMLTLATGAPKADVRLQMACIMLELGPDIRKALLNQDVLGGLMSRDTDRIDVISKLLPHIVGAAGMEDEVRLNRDDLMLEFSADAHFGRVKALRDLEKGLVPRIKAVYSNEWMEANVADQTLRHTRSRRPFTLKTTIPYEGKMYRIEKVSQSFRFSPASTLDPGGVGWDEQMIKDINPSTFIRINGAQQTPVPWRERKGEEVFVYLVLDRSGNVERVSVKDTDDENIHLIQNIIAIHNNMENLRQLGEILETGAEWMMVVVYLIPGAGQAVMAGELVVGVLQFLASGEFDDIKKLLGGDGVKMLRAGYDKISGAFEVDKLWDLLIDDQVALPAISQDTAPALSSTSGIHKEGKLRKFVNRLKKIGKYLYGGLQRLKSSFNFLLKRLRLFVNKHPAFRRLVSMIGQYIEIIRTKVKMTADMLGDQEKPESGSITDFNGQANQMVSHLQTLEVPKDIIPLQGIVDLVITLALNKIAKGPKKLIVKGVREVLVQLGIYDKITGYVADHLKGSFVDPNNILNDIIDDEVQPAVHKAGTEFATTATGILKEVPGLEGMEVKPPSSTAITKVDMPLNPDEDEEDLPDMQPYLSDGAEGRERSGASYPLIRSSSGRRMDQADEQDLSVRFGQHFSHVRVHASAPMDEEMRSIGAEALTSGSHIYLKSNLRINSEPGQSIFYHELAHVIQQTGPRPSSGQYSDLPVSGKPEGGVRSEPQSEREAEAFARAGKEGSKVPSVQRTSLEGYQPKIGDVVMFKFFRSISDYPKLTDSKITDVVKPNVFVASLGARLSQQERTFAENLNHQLKSKFASLDYAPAMKDGAEEIKSLLQGKDWGSYKNLFEDIVRRSKVKKKTDKNDPGKEEWEMNMVRVKAGLEEAVAIQTGILLDINFTSPGATAQTIDKVKVRTLFLDQISLNAGLWEKIIKNTFVVNKSTLGFKTKYTDASLKEYKDGAKYLIEKLEPTRIFKGKDFSLTNYLARQLENHVFPDIKELATGSQADPIPIYWYKNIRDYPQSIKLAGKTYGMRNLAKIVHDGESIQVGVSDKYIINAAGGVNSRQNATKLQRGTTSSRDSAMTKTFRQALAALKYPWKNEDVDHVKDLGFGGDDVYENFWPLNSTINRTPFYEQWLMRYKVEYKEGKEHKVDSLKELKGKWFIIKGFRIWPESPGGRWRQK